MSEWGTKQHKAEQNWMKNAWRDEKKLQRIRIKSWIIITNSYIIKTSDERWMNEWMSLWMEITDTELCSAALWWWFFLLYWGVEKCVAVLHACSYHMEINSFLICDLWLIVSVKKQKKAVSFMSSTALLL